jgi:hypothetical protein
MLVRHNTELLEKAVDLAVKRAAIPTLQAEAAAQQTMARAAGMRRLATGGAIAVAAVGIGLGVMLGFWQNEETIASGEEEMAKTAELVTPPEPTPEPVVPRASEETPATPPLPTPRPPLQDQLAEALPDIPTVDYTKFSNLQVRLFGREWLLEAGHHFQSERDASWDYAWCYTRQSANGVEVKVDLANRLSPTSPPMGPIANVETLEEAGLTDDAALELASKCAWLDSPGFTVDDFQPDPARPPARQASLEKAVPSEFVSKDGWDAIGHDLAGMPIRNVTQQDCEATCRDNAQCLATTYNKTFQACFLKGDASILVRNGNSTVWAKDVVANNMTLSDLAFAQQQALVGHSYQRAAASYPDCVLACAEDAKCRGFNHAGTTCELLDTVAQSADEAATSSGMKSAASQ